MDIYKELIDVKFCDLFKQFDMMIINFGDEITHSLHVNCFLRIVSGDRILLTSTDEFFLADGTQKTEEDFRRLEEQKVINDTDSLLFANIKTVKNLLRNRKVRQVETTLNGDLFIRFDNDVVIQIIPDCIPKNYEYYRFIRFSPHWCEDCNDYKSTHYVVCSEVGKIVCN